MVDLHPDLPAFSAADPGPLAEFIQLALILQHHAAGAGHGAAVDHHVTGDQQPGTTLGPGLVKAQQFSGRALAGVSQVFFHRRLGNAVGDDSTVGQVQRLKGSHGVLRGSRWSKAKVKVNFKVNSPEY